MTMINCVKQMENEIKAEENNVSKLPKIYQDYSEKQDLIDFYTLRNRLVSKSRSENLKQVNDYQEVAKMYPNNINNQGVIQLGNIIIFNPDINIKIDNMLEENGFDLAEEGTKYLSRLIEILYHERSLYYEHGNKFDYFNLDDYSNIHYEMLGVTKEQVIYQIISSIVTNELEIGYPISKIVYECVDNLGYHSIDRDNKKRRKMLINS